MTPISPPRLNRKGLFNPLKGLGDLLHFRQPLHICLQHFATGGRTRRGKGVGRLHQHGFDRGHLNVVVMRLDGVDHGLGFVIFFQ